MKHTECKDCKLSNGDCGYHFKMDETTNFDIPSLSACDKYGNCEFFKSKEKPKGDLISREALKKATKSFTDCDGFNPVWQIIDNAPTVELNQGLTKNNQDSNQGDLISRKALKENGTVIGMVNGQKMKVIPLSVIDNAPSAETSKIEHKAYNEGFKDGVEQGIKLSESPTGKWIPVKTRELTEEEKEEYPDATFMYDCNLPDDGEEVLVTTWGGNVALDTFCRDDGCYFENYCDEEDVIAWQPLPEPYKGDAE